MAETKPKDKAKADFKKGVPLSKLPAGKMLSGQVDGEEVLLIYLFLIVIAFSLAFSLLKVPLVRLFKAHFSYLNYSRIDFLLSNACWQLISSLAHTKNYLKAWGQLIGSLLMKSYRFDMRTSLNTLFLLKQ